MVNTEMKGDTKISLGDVRDVLIIVGIFLFFTGWTYVYYFYNYFGLSASLVSLDYSDYIVYSYLVLTSYHGLPLLALAILIFVYRSRLRKYISFSILLAVLLFPLLYILARNVANQNAQELRIARNTMRHISFVFKKDAGVLAYDTADDSLPASIHPLRKDLDILKDTSLPSHLYLLGQNQDYFFVLNQSSGQTKIKDLPFGTIYFVNKNDVLYSKITLE